MKTYIEQLREQVWRMVEYCHANRWGITVRRIRRLCQVDARDRSRIVFITRILREFQEAGKLRLTKSPKKQYTIVNA